MDPVSGSVAATALVTLGPTVRNLVERAAGPAADEVGEWLRDKVRDYRRRNTQHVGEQADQLIRTRGDEVQEVPLSILLPLLEAASLQDDEEMQTYWATLLANAAAGHDMSPAYIRILEALRPIDARVLNACGQIDAEARTSPPEDGKRTGYVASRAEIADRSGVASALDLEIALDSLTAFRLVDQEPALYPLEPTGAGSELSIRVTSLGRALLHAVDQDARAPTAG